jgi:hypothetical protein
LFHIRDIPIQQLRIIILSIILLLSGYSVGCIGSIADTHSGTTTTVILIRHAERDNFFILTDKGHERAKALIDAVRNMGIQAIYSPDLVRDLDTVGPLANYLDIDVTLTPRITKPVVDKIISEILAKHVGEVVLMVGNGSGNLRTLHHRLGGTGEGPHAYGDLFIYRISNQGSVKVIKSKFGP